MQYCSLAVLSAVTASIVIPDMLKVKVLVAGRMVSLLLQQLGRSPSQAVMVFISVGQAVAITDVAMYSNPKQINECELDVNDFPAMSFATLLHTIQLLVKHTCTEATTSYTMKGGGASYTASTALNACSAELTSSAC